ncbi:type II toxin-antitoxin system HipA family toxin [Agromyces protaetiae]|uniref:Type II toxin-antitoxin system HipA family toxin n=1 Tax=Agromyces protaetiae TaxID=2509455 RepID=A0A4P6FKI9_9MICO|nr:HipA domain-containing protein [Agromyces protaetiae]QAY74497.1 type II toxin-antitoxin system HipA family toxin [Agromyces protaetiae]
MRLAVELYETVIGYLEGDDGRSFDFGFDDTARARFGSTSRVLSVSIPVVPTPPRQSAHRRRNWFSELLPEGDQLDYLLAQSGVRRGDTLRFLARYGRDVAGALQIWDADDPTEPKIPETSTVEDHEIRRLLEDPIGAPLGNASELGRTSLGGVQPKIVLAREADGWARALGGFPSTHILKPRLAAHPTVIYDEEYGARLARALGLADFDTRVDSFDGLATLVVERFDRVGGRRLHQEDFNQVLGASGNQKYQEIGGVVSFARAADALARYASTEDLRNLARMLVLAVAIGNLDLHTKNLGLLHPADGTVRLAPAYDQVPIAHVRGNDGRMALAVNREYRHAALTRDDLAQEIAGWGVRRADATVTDALEELRSAIEREDPIDGAHPALRSSLRTFTDNLLLGHPVGIADE